MAKKNPNKNELTITRISDAPRELVWKAWTEPGRLSRWWGPKGWTLPVCKIDLRVGGECFSCMRSPEGQEIWSKGIFREVVAPERLVMTDSFADEQGNVVPATHYGMSPEFQMEMLITAIFEDQKGKTKLTLKHSGIEGISDTDRDDMRQGWSQSLDKLAELLAKDKTERKAA